MPKYKATLEVEINLPELQGHPELTITPEEAKESLLETRLGGYAVTGGHPRKRTGDMRVLKVTFASTTCKHCGCTVPVKQ